MFEMKENLILVNYKVESVAVIFKLFTDDAI